MIMRGFLSLTFLIAVTGLLGACGPSEAEVATAYAETQAVVDARTTEAAATQKAIQATDDMRETSIAASATVAFEAAATETRAIEVTSTRIAERTAAKEATIAVATGSARSLYDKVLELAGDGYLSTTDGEYHEISDFDKSWAQINWYQWWHTDHSPRDFVIRADAYWDSASETANWFNSGCGFVFREKNADNHYLAFLAMDGNVRFARSVRGVWRNLGYSYYGKLDIPMGNAEIMLVVEGEWFTFFVNGEKVHSRQDQGLHSGSLALTLLSGTNKSYGTRCRMTNIELWILD
jgi:hypothetical protein